MPRENDTRRFIYFYVLLWVQVQSKNILFNVSALIAKLTIAILKFTIAFDLFHLYTDHIFKWRCNGNCAIPKSIQSYLSQIVSRNIYKAIRL